MDRPNGGIGGIASRATDRLTDKRIDAFIRKGAPGNKLADGGGMHLLITPASTPVWRINYRYGGKYKTFAVGVYPDVSLKAARAKRAEVRSLLAEGRDPVQVRSMERAATVAASGDTFDVVMRSWLKLKKQSQWSEAHHTKSIRALERDILPRIGKLPVSDIAPQMVTAAIEAIIQRGAVDTAGKILQHVNGIFRLAQARGLCRDNPASPAQEILHTKNARPLPALLDRAALGMVLRDAELTAISPAVRMAHRLCAFTATRVSNVVAAEWPEFNLDAEVPMWTIPRKKMKARDRQHDHKVILGPTIAGELLAWKRLTGGAGYLFWSPRDPKTHISREALEKAYRVSFGLADKHSPHSWRSAFSTLARDSGKERDVVELALDHVHDNDVARAYDRGERLQQRIALMQWWDKELSQAQAGADIIQIRKVSK